MRRRGWLIVAGASALLSALSAWHQHFLAAAAVFAAGVAWPLYRFGGEPVRAGDPTAGEASPVLHPAPLEDLEAAGYGAGFLGEIADGFAQDGARLLDDMEAALRTEDLPGFRDLAHTLKGNAVSVGAQRLAESCQRAEADARPRDTMMRLRAEFQLALAALDGYLQQSRSTS